jgi:hypothetical protein
VRKSKYVYFAVRFGFRRPCPLAERKSRPRLLGLTVTEASANVVERERVLRSMALAAHDSDSNEPNVEASEVPGKLDLLALRTPMFAPLTCIS